MAVGGRKPVSMARASGSALPADSTLKVPLKALVALICVSVRLVASLPGRNSCTRPATSTLSPTSGLVPVLPRNT